jgi:hypothetical protein
MKKVALKVVKRANSHEKCPPAIVSSSKQQLRETTANFLPNPGMLMSCKEKPISLVGPPSSIY